MRAVRNEGFPASNVARLQCSYRGGILEVARKSSPPSPEAEARQRQRWAYSFPSFTWITKPVPPHFSQSITQILVQVAAETLGLAAPPELFLRLALDLPDALPREPEALADLLERAGILPVEAEPHADHVALLLVELGDDRLDLLDEGRAHELDLHGRNRVLLEGIPELELAVLPDGGGEGDVLSCDPEEVLDGLLGEVRLLRDLLGRREPLELRGEAVTDAPDPRRLAGHLLGKP